MANNGIFPQNQAVPVGYTPSVFNTQPNYGYVNSPVYSQPQRTYIPQPQAQQMMQPAQQPQVQTIKGRMVNDESEITAQEVPMDGTVSYFPKSDYSCIFAKVWNNEGGISTFKFVPELETVEEEQTDTTKMEDLKEVNNKLDEILAYLSKPNKPYQNKGRNNHNNKEQTNES